MEQLSLLKTVLNEYADESGSIDNTSLYERVCAKLDIDTKHYIQPVGKAQTNRNLFHRKIRWVQPQLETCKISETSRPRNMGAYKPRQD